MPFCFCYFWCMKRFSLFKHAVLALALFFLIVGLRTLNTINLKDGDFVGQVLLSSFSVSSAFVLLTYRISLIDLKRIQWIPFALVLIIMALLVTMKYATIYIPTIWDLTMVLFMMLVCYTMTQRTSHKNAFTYIAIGLMYLTLLMLLIAIGLKIASTSFYSALNLLLIITSIAAVIHFFLPKKITQ